MRSPACFVTLLDRLDFAGFCWCWVVFSSLSFYFIFLPDTPLLLLLFDYYIDHLAPGGAFQQKYRRPIFVGCLICVTGFNVDVRDEIEQDTVNNGGRYVPDLGSTVTHLIADRPTGEKYVVARRLGITVVTHAWFKRCLETSGLAGWLNGMFEGRGYLGWLVGW